MSINKKNSRQIIVAGVKYRWVFSENSGWNDVTIQAASGKGSKLVAQFPWNKINSEYVIDISQEDQIVPPPYDIITPSTVEKLIEFGLGNGWDTNSGKKPFKCRYNAHDKILLSLN